MGYSKEVFTEKKEMRGVKKTLAVEANLAFDKEKPLMHAGYSVYKVTLIEVSSTNKVYVNANIPASDVSGIYEKYLQSVVFKNNVATVAPEPATPVNTQTPLAAAFSTTIKMGKNTGKTYGAVLSEPNGRGDLERQRSFLKENLQKFPNNQREIDKLNLVLNATSDEIAALSKAAPIPAQTTSNTSSVVKLYESATKPLRSRKDDAGREFVYKIQITYNPEMNYPYEVDIINCYAPVSEKDSGVRNPVLSQAVNKKALKSRLSAAQGAELMNRLKKTISDFETIGFAGQYKLACEIEKAEYNKSKSEQ